MIKTAYQLGVRAAMESAGLMEKTAINPNTLAALGAASAPAGIGAGIGALAAGEGDRLQGALAGGAMGLLGGAGGAAAGLRSAGNKFWNAKLRHLYSAPAVRDAALKRVMRMGDAKILAGLGLGGVAGGAAGGAISGS